ncbi:SDR family NAD(P)-dependent oxidoreductase [Maritalea porphyrae]|uniref:SDR family NAD(P)-dependent oxidoreductase n=1 Tax=Maritalea porphyrae TaxID=880732 RepID=UPI0022AF8F74|nr:SDR family NAD(P)-dependent oxidoreductase [Maritalea porphyrae]MCZ4273504.1 SDR family NAD(P)-dependent oxidoreductase [Maritalea porphyrae]
MDHHHHDEKRRIWITGASSGIGYALAERLAGQGDSVAISARSEGKLNELASASSNIAAYPLDVTEQKRVHEVIEAIEADGAIDIAVLNAGAWALMDADEMDVGKIRNGFEVNYMGVIYALEKLIPLMKARGHGHIAIMASVAGFRGLPRSMAYGPTKAALINLAETLKPELEKFGIHVTVINPGFVDTPATKDNPFPMPDLITADEAARFIAEGLDKQKVEIIFPWRFALIMKALRVLPYRPFYWAMRRIMGQ